MSRVTEVAPDIYQISVFNPDINLQFNHFLIKDEEPLLFHTGYRKMFPVLREALEKVIDPASIRWISFSHFESDECGALNEWLQVAPDAQAVCSLVGALVNINDFALRPPKPMTADDTLITGKHRFRYIPTPQLPHGWDAGVLFEETQGTLLCSDLFHQWGDREPVTDRSVLDRCSEALTQIQASPLADYVPYTPNTGRIFGTLAALKPRTVAPQHGSTYVGACDEALRQLSALMEQKLGGTSAAAR